VEDRKPDRARTKLQTLARHLKNPQIELCEDATGLWVFDKKRFEES
jgi:hypothetical protein